MLVINYINEKTQYQVQFKVLTDHAIELLGDFPAKEKGFTLSREGQADNWDYSEFTTIYREVEGGIQFSDDGSVYVAPVQPPEPEPQEPYIPTLGEIKEQKISEMNAVQQAIIQEGVDVTLADGTVERFTLKDHDQTSLIGLQLAVAQGSEKIPWHTADQSEPCKYYSNEDMNLITTQAMAYVTFHVTYFRDLRRYIEEMETIDEVMAVQYGIYIPAEHQSEVLSDLYAAQGL